jgi:hypothetical protein
MPDNLNEILASITDKAKRLKDKTIRLEKENKAYHETTMKHLATIADLQHQLKTNQGTDNASKVATLTNADVSKLKKDIDKYVKVIDKAMAQLQKN